MRPLRGKALMVYGFGTLLASALPPWVASNFGGTALQMEAGGLLSVLMGLFGFVCFMVGLGSLDEDKAMP